MPSPVEGPRRSVRHCRHEHDRAPHPAPGPRGRAVRRPGVGARRPARCTATISKTRSRSCAPPTPPPRSPRSPRCAPPCRARKSADSFARVGYTIMGVVNVTPDSFSDGGRYLDPHAAVEHGRRLAVEGAQMLDVGGESTRPGADAVPARRGAAARAARRRGPRRHRRHDLDRHVQGRRRRGGARRRRELRQRRDRVPGRPGARRPRGRARRRLLPHAHARHAAHDAGRPALRRRRLRRQGVPRSSGSPSRSPRGCPRSG